MQSCTTSKNNKSRMVRSFCIPVRLIPFVSPFSFFFFFLTLFFCSLLLPFSNFSSFFSFFSFLFSFSFSFPLPFSFSIYFYFYFSSCFSYSSAFFFFFFGLSSFSFLFEGRILSTEAEQGQINVKWHQEYSKSPHYYLESHPNLNKW